jgi:phenylalanyl-tRNA synthetase beta chain
MDVYDAKGLAEHALAALGVAARTETGGRLGGFEPDCHGSLVIEAGERVGEFGEIAGDVRARLGLDAPVFAAALRLDALPVARAFAPARPLPRFPSVQRDMAFAIAEPGLSVTTVQEAIARAAGPLLREVVVFDVFRLPDGARSVAWRLTFQADDRTLTDDEVNAVHAHVAGHVGREFGIALRGGDA